MVADIEELESLDASEIHAQRLHTQEKITPRSGQHFILPIADGTSKLSGRDDQPDRGEWHRPVRGEQLSGIFWAMLAEKCLDLFPRTHVFLPCLPYKKTNSWDLPHVTLLGYARCGSKSGFATLLVSKQFCTIKCSCWHEEKCTSILFGSTLTVVV